MLHRLLLIIVISVYRAVSVI